MTVNLPNLSRAGRQPVGLTIHDDDRPDDLTMMVAAVVRTISKSFVEEGLAWSQPRAARAQKPRTAEQRLRDRRDDQRRYNSAVQAVVNAAAQRLAHDTSSPHHKVAVRLVATLAGAKNTEVAVDRLRHRATTQEMLLARDLTREVKAALRDIEGAPLPAGEQPPRPKVQVTAAARKQMARDKAAKVVADQQRQTATYGPVMANVAAAARTLIDGGYRDPRVIVAAGQVHAAVKASATPKGAVAVLRKNSATADAYKLLASLVKATVRRQTAA